MHRDDKALTAGLVPLGDLGGGWAAAVRIAAGEPITPSELTRSGAGSGLGAMSIPVSVDRADGGGVDPGDRVDVLASNGGGGGVVCGAGFDGAGGVVNEGSGVLGAASGDYLGDRGG